jgi:protein tyrosine/serine phosphatase
VDDRRLTWDACLNVRDLGGLPTAGGGTISWGALVRADLLCRLTEAGRRDLLAHGVRTIVDLRSAAECAREPNPFAAPSGADLPDYLNLPTDGALDPLAGSPRADASAADLGRHSLDVNGARFAAVAGAVASARPGGVLLHCHAGKDRTGVAIALLLAVAGVPDEAIAADYALSGANIERLASQWLDAVARSPEERVRLAARAVPHPEVMLETLAHLRSVHGGADRYLRAHGASASDLEALRARLVG